MRATDKTETGLRMEGAYENDRNAENAACWKAVVRECFGVQDVICGHHIIYEARDKHADGYTYDVVQEFPSADALIFDHAVARKIWGTDWQGCLTKLALEPIETRDALFSRLYYARPNAPAQGEAR